MTDQVQIVPDKGGYRVNVWLEGKQQRTAWLMTLRRAQEVAREFAEYYGPNRHEPLPITYGV